MTEFIAHKLCPLTDQRLALGFLWWGNIEIPEKRSGKGSSQSVPYVRLYCSRGLVCFLKEKFNRPTLYKYIYLISEVGYRHQSYSST